MKKLFTIIAILFTFAAFSQPEVYDGLVDVNSETRSTSTYYHYFGGEPSLDSPTLQVNLLDTLSTFKYIYMSDTTNMSVYYSTFIGVYIYDTTSNIDFIAFNEWNDSLLIDNTIFEMGKNYRITFKLTTPSNTFYTFTFHVIDTTQSTASIEENRFEKIDLAVYPSPATTDIKIRFNTTQTDMPIRVYSMGGLLVYQDNERRDYGTTTLDVNISNFMPGIYMATNGSETVKFIKL